MRFEAFGNACVDKNAWVVLQHQLVLDRVLFRLFLFLFLNLFQPLAALFFVLLGLDGALVELLGLDDFAQFVARFGLGLFLFLFRFWLRFSAAFFLYWLAVFVQFNDLIKIIYSQYDSNSIIQVLIGGPNCTNLFLFGPSLLPFFRFLNMIIIGV